MIDVGSNVDFESTSAMRSFINRSISDLTLDELVDAAAKARSRGGREKIRYRYLHMTKIGADSRLTWRHDQRQRRNYAHILDKLQQLTELAPKIAMQSMGLI